MALLVLIISADAVVVTIDVAVTVGETVVAVAIVES